MTLLKSLSIYTFASFFNKGLVFVLGFVVSHYFTKADWGVLAKLNTTTLLTSIIIGVGAKAALSVKYYKIDRKQLNEYFSALLVTPIILFVIVLLLSQFLQQPISQFLEIPPIWIYYFLILAFGQFLNDLVLTLYRIKEKPKQFAYFNVGLGILNFALSLFIIIGLEHTSWEGRAIGIFSSNILFAAIGLVIFQKQGLFTTRFKWQQVKEVLIFGIPLVPHLIGSFAVEYSDTYFIAKMLNDDELGLYSWGYRFGMIIQILVSSFAMGYGPFLFASLKDLTPHLAIKIVRITYFFIVGLFIAVWLLNWFSPFLFYWLIDESLFPATQYIFWIALAYFFLGGYSLFANFIHYSGKTYIFTILAVINVGLNLVLNYYLILEYGAMGAAYATAISYLFIFLSATVIALRMYKLPWFDPKVFDLKEIRHYIKW